MTNKVKKGVLFFALSPFATVGCVLLGAGAGAVLTAAGVIAGLTAGVWMPVVGAKIGEQQDLDEAARKVVEGVKAAGVPSAEEIAAALPPAPKMDQPPSALRDAIKEARSQWEQVMGAKPDGSPSNG
jgi:hypothetical protein